MCCLLHAIISQRMSLCSGQTKEGLERADSCSAPYYVLVQVNISKSLLKNEITGTLLYFVFIFPGKVKKEKHEMYFFLI